MHKEVMDFLREVKRDAPQFFDAGSRCRILELGSRNVNGSPRSLFDGFDEYVGIDLMDGEGVDIVGEAHHAYWQVGGNWDVVISTEMLEHDRNAHRTLESIEMLTNPYSLVVFTCATTGRKEHGTKENNPQDSPATTDYYKNVTEKDFRRYLPERLFGYYYLRTDFERGDLFFFGIRK